MNAAAYKAMQDRIELLSRLILDTDEAELAEFIGAAERADSLGAVLDPTAWMRGHDSLRMVATHARALSTARRSIHDAAVLAGAGR